MATTLEPSHSHPRIVASSNEKLGHWFPAMRPDDLDEIPDSSPVDTGAPTMGITPPFPRNLDSLPISSDVQSQPQDEVFFQEQDSITSANTAPLWTSEPPSNGGAGDELPSDDDDERLDPAWGIKRMDSTQILQTVNRSTTFPDFGLPTPTEPSLGSAFPGVSENRQAEHEETDILTKPIQDDAYTIEPQQTPWLLQEEQDLVQEQPPWTISEQSDPDTELAERFDEGIPLIQTNDSKDKEVEANVESNPWSSEAPQDETGIEDGFFSGLNNLTSNSTQRKPLERKSTAQVLDALDFERPARLDSPAILENTETSFFEQLHNEPADESLVSQPPATEEVDAMWAAALEDDEFLVEDADDLLPDSEPGSPSSFMASLRRDGLTTVPEDQPTSANATQAHQSSPRRQNSFNPYAPHQPLVADMLHMSPDPTTHNNLGLIRPGLPQHALFGAQGQQRPAAPQPMKSFVDQSKDGYKSPYDLPVDITKSRKRAAAPHAVQTNKTLPPPPRSSSLSEKPLQSPFNPPYQQNSTAHPPSSTSAAPVVSRSVSAFTPPSKPPVTHKTTGSGSFFEELPAVSRPRPVSNQGRYTPQQTVVQPPQLPPPSPPYKGTVAEPPSPPRASDPYAAYQLQPPERLDPYANISLQAPLPSPSTTNARYSPAPPTAQLGARSGPSPRYSPAPPTQPSSSTQGNRYASQPVSTPQAPAAAPPINRYVSQPPPNALPPSNVLPFQPRTSSPLAVHKRSTDETNAGIPPAITGIPRPGMAGRQSSHNLNFTPQSTINPEGANLSSSTLLTSPPKRQAVEALPPPRRSQTQSPSKQRPQPSFQNLISDYPNRPASAYGQSSPSKSFAQLASDPPARTKSFASSLGTELDFVRPADDSQFDPLERWKGAPLITFGFAGTLVTSFPKHVPRYTTGVARPQIKAMPGEFVVRQLKDLITQNELINSFPGPLRGKAKKKDLLSWMASYISGLESSQPENDPHQSPMDSHRRHHEKLLLWKIVRVLVENDGSLEGPALNAVNVILSPEVHAVDDTTASKYRTDEQITGIYRPSGGNARSDSVDPLAAELLRKHLLAGNRQAAIFHAMDARLWSHALIIASTMERSVWSQVVREFVRQEVKTIGTNAESLSALYEIFGGNIEESIDELVPPSARAGLQMVSKVDSLGPTKNALDGLNHWKETLSLVLNNRAPGDHQALAVLGKLLEDYQRIEAAHICYLFSRSPAKPVIMGGIDDAQADIVLLGADHKTRPSDFMRNQEAVILTEIYEFATNVLISGSTPVNMPHLSAFKLQKAGILAENGMKSEAQAYCEAIASMFKSSTKLSPYYHSLFLTQLDDLSARLKQTPIQGSASWIGKPSLEKVSGSVWNKFTTFVAGDDSDAESKGSGKDAAEAGPFANVSGTPSLSRTGSQSDLYGSYPLASPPAVSNTIAGSRYAPNGIHSPRSSSELTRGRPSLDSQRSPPATSHLNSSRQYEPVNMLQQNQMVQPLNPYQALAAASPPTNYPQSPPGSSYLPNSVTQLVQDIAPPVHHEPYAPTPPAEDTVSLAYGHNPQFQQHGQFGYSEYEYAEPPLEQTPPVQDEVADAGYAPPAQSYGYEASAENGYIPYEPEPESPEESKPKKKSFIGDDDDDFPQATPTAHRGSQDDEADRKRANDAAADAAFRAAAEADANREKEKMQAKRSSSWFGGWLGGKKAPEGLDSGSSKSADAKVYRANLGESKMKLYYDKELGKWVNPDNPDAGVKTATPPPPRMGGTPGPSSGPPKSVGSGHVTSSSLPNVSMGSPSLPGSRAGTPASGSMIGVPAAPYSAGLSGPPSAASTPPLGLAPTSHPGLAALVPPPRPGSRPGTAVSNASSIDDLIGPPGGRKGAKSTKKAKGRYVDVMAQ
ncbi:hypothetical protein LTR84_000893 [Exophiala bonariae]|uniref:Protein transport protein sec16 n=1 Tax=Exophiala bonariae TaxID=1690606 RepID=A0AAV9NVZ2_9EURO|nr:hypothetical protein LTR84_000893 [Exophiala bonariae]